MGFRNDSPSKFINALLPKASHSSPIQTNPRGRSRTFKKQPRPCIPTPNHLCSLPPPPPLEKLVPGETIYWLQNSGSICVQIFSHWKTILFLSKYKKTRGTPKLWIFHSLLNLEQALKYRVINLISQSPTPNHLCSLPPPPPLEKLVPGETIYWLQNSGSICVQIFSHWKTYFIFVKIQEN